MPKFNLELFKTLILNFAYIHSKRRKLGMFIRALLAREHFRAHPMGREGAEGAVIRTSLPRPSSGIAVAPCSNLEAYPIMARS